MTEKRIAIISMWIAAAALAVTCMQFVVELATQ